MNKRWKTLWTVVMLHGVSNAAVAMRALETPGFVETVPGLSTMIALQFPLVAYGVYPIYKVAPQPVTLDTAWSQPFVSIHTGPLDRLCSPTYS
jgi:hypothetical protein